MDKANRDFISANKVLQMECKDLLLQMREAVSKFNEENVRAIQWLEKQKQATKKLLEKAEIINYFKVACK